MGLTVDLWIFDQFTALSKQGRIHGNPVADGWAGAVMRKPLAIQKCDRQTNGRTDRPTNRAWCRVACPRLKMNDEQRKTLFSPSCISPLLDSQSFQSLHGRLDQKRNINDEQRKNLV